VPHPCIGQAPEGPEVSPAPASHNRIKLDKLIEEAIVDCYGESEEIGGFCSMLEDKLDLPFQTDVLGVRVMVAYIDLTDREEIDAICTPDRTRQAISLLELPIPVPPPQGAEWIEACRRWARGGR
jgi:hypothetical protein